MRKNMKKRRMKCSEKVGIAEPLKHSKTFLSTLLLYRLFVFEILTVKMG